MTDSEDESKVEKLRKNRLERVKEIKESKRKRKAVADIEDGEVDSEGNKTENTLCDLQPELVFRNNNDHMANFLAKKLHLSFLTPTILNDLLTTAP